MIRYLIFIYLFVLEIYFFTGSDSYICGDKVVVLSKFGSTLGDLPSDFTEYPMFPGIDPSRLVGKKFETLAIDIQIMKNDKIKRSWHFEDWVCAL